MNRHAFDKMWIHLGWAGRSRYRQLQEYDPVQLKVLREEGLLQSHLERVERQYEASLDRMVEQMLEKEPGPKSGPARAGHMAALRRSAEEVLFHELIAAPAPETRRAMEDGYRDGMPAEDKFGP